MNKEQFKTGITKEDADKIVGIIEKHAFFKESSKKEAQRYLRRKQQKEERLVFVDGEYRDKDDLDGKKQAAAARRENRKKNMLIAVGIFIVLAAFAMCVLTAKGINPLDDLKVQTLSKFHIRF